MKTFLECVIPAKAGIQKNKLTSLSGFSGQARE